MQEKDREYIKADIGLLLILLLILTIAFTVILLVLSLILSGKAVFLAVFSLSVLYALISIYAVLYFLTVRYEKKNGYIKVFSGLIIRRITYINTESLPFVVNYSLPFKKGFSIVYLYGGTQVIFSTKVL